MDRGAAPEEVRNLRVPAKSLKRLRKTVTDAGPGGTAHAAGARSASRRSGRWPARCCSTRCSASSRPGHHAVRSGAARRPGARLRASPPQGDRARRSLPRRAAALRHRARRALPLGGGPLPPGGRAWRSPLFDQTKALHGLGDREREWLEYASLLHDIGNHISYERHHRHSHYLIKNGDLRGFEPDEIEVIAPGGALSPPRHAQAQPRGLRRPVAGVAEDGARAGRDPARGRNARPQPPRGGRRGQLCAIAARTCACRSRRWATPSSRSGPAAASWTCSRRNWASPSIAGQAPA